MFSLCKYLYLCVIPVVYYLQLCASEPVYPPTLVLYSPGEPEYTDVLVKREHENMTLVCEVRGDRAPRNYVWNYVSNGTTGQRPYTVEPVGATTSSQLTKLDLQVSDSGQYMCSAPPFSVTKYIIVQTKGPLLCARGAFWCGARCVLAAYVCDGRADCSAGEDEALCAPDLCSRNDKLNCSSGRCISASACCHGSSPLCRQPACCDEYPLTRIQGFVDEYPPLYEDRHAPDDYGFIQSTIYTVTACALIFMIAVVLLVSAICKMHMKRTALRGYTHAERATSHHYTMQYAQAHRFPPCYEASRLLEENRNASPQASPVHATTPPEPEPHCPSESPLEAPRGLARLSSIFSSRYRQVPTQPEPVELQTVRSTSLQNSPTRRPLNDYRSPTYCDLNAEFLFTNPETPDLGRDLNYMATPIEFFRRRTMRRNTLERVMDQLDRQRLTLQLGRFQLSIPRFGRPDPRPDTPNVAEINIDDLDFVRLNSNDTYTLNGRTIRLLGANFENYPVMPDGSVRPPPYTEAVRYKLYGPPPEYLSREGLNRRSADTVDQEATSNIEMPPCYEDLNAINTVSDGNGNVSENNGAVSENNGTVSGSNGVVSASNGAVSGNNDVFNGNNDIGEENRLNTATNASVEVNVNVHNSNSDFGSTQNESQVETLSSIIDNLPAIDSDINANDMDINNDNLVTGCGNNRSVINISTGNNVILSADSNVINRSVINVDNGNVINNE